MSEKRMWAAFEDYLNGPATRRSFDEQPSTHFYGYYISFDATGIEPVDHVLKAVADAGRGSHDTEDWTELGLVAEVQRAAERAAEEFRSRDAEVQALREALEDMLSGWHYIRANHGDLYGVGWERAQNRAEAALAGEKGSSDD